MSESLEPVDSSWFNTFRGIITFSHFPHFLTEFYRDLGFGKTYTFLEKYPEGISP